VLVATAPVDFRKGAEGLAALVREQMHSNPFSGAVYVFRVTLPPIVIQQRLESDSR
jgi:transposase